MQEQNALQVPVVRDVHAEGFSKFNTETQAERLADKFRVRTYAEKFRVLRIAMLVLSLLFNVFSILTSSVLVYYAVFEVSGSSVLSAAVCVVSLSLLELIKRVVWGTGFKDRLQFGRIDGVLIVIGVIAMIASILMSYFGGKRLVVEWSKPAPVVRVDSAANVVLSQIASIDQQIEDANAMKWRGNTTRKGQEAVAQLAESKALLTKELARIQAETDAGNAKIVILAQGSTALKAEYFAALSLLLELLFLGCIFWLEYYDWRSYVELAGKGNREQRAGSSDESIEDEETATDLGSMASHENSKVSKSVNLGSSALYGDGVHRPIGYVVSDPFGGQVANNSSEIRFYDNRRSCRNCGKKYVHGHKKQKYCTDVCRWEAARLRTGKNFNFSINKKL